MELSRKAIDELRFKNRNGKYYYAKEVDEALEAIAEAAEQQQQELERLKQLEAENTAEKVKIAEALLSAKKLTAQYVEQEKARCAAELREYQAKKLQTEQEIKALEQAKKDVVAGFRREVAVLKLTIESFAEGKGITESEQG